MNRTKILIITAILFISCKEKNNDLKDYNLNSDVRKIQNTSFEGSIKFGNPQTGKKKDNGNSITIFNKEGNITEYQSLDIFGNTEWVNRYSYNKNGIKKEVITLKKGEIERKEVSEIEDDRIIKLDIYNEYGTLDEIIEFEYDKREIVSGTIKNELGKINRSFENIFKEEMLEKQIIKDSLNQTIYSVHYKRNKNNDIIEYTYSNEKDSLLETENYKYEYDEKKNWIKRIEFNEKSELESIVNRNIIYFSDNSKNKSENDFIGLWYVIGKEDWVEIRKDKKYDFGSKSKIQSSGYWEIDSKTEVLTLRANDKSKSKKFKFQFEGYQLVLYTMEWKYIMKLENR